MNTEVALQSVQHDYEGLTSEEVAKRRARGQCNEYRATPALSYGAIFRNNVWTRFNLLLVTLFVAILVFGHVADGFFGVVVFCNAVIGIAQELRAKWTLERLSIVTAPRIIAWRDGTKREIGKDDVVLDDLLEVRRGDQIVADGAVVMSSAMLIDESLLTGEARPVGKDVGDTLMSGSFVIAGMGRYRVTQVGANSYANRITNEARHFVPLKSDLTSGINTILRLVGWALVPVTVLLLVSQEHVHESFNDLVTAVTAGLVAMVPQGLVLLTTIAFAVSAIRLSQHGVLVQELAAVEGLARVDTICFDKTGTLTAGRLVFSGAELLHGNVPYELALAGLSVDTDETPVIEALHHAFPRPNGWVRIRRIPFSSARRWSGATFEGRGSWAIGAVETLFRDDHELVAHAEQYAASGKRVLALASSDGAFDAPVLPADLQPVALLLFEEQLRAEAADTITYLKQEGVDLKVISGDSPTTASFVALRAGIPHASAVLSGSELPASPQALATSVANHSVFGRISPQQKREIIWSLQSSGHSVAMIGDGVNDVLALKSADISVAIGTGAPAARAVARVALLDGRFALMPQIIAEGRRVTANIERVANLFIVKTVWAVTLALLVGLSLSAYPLLPRHLTIVDTLTIGIPSFFLALAPSTRRYLPGFVKRVAKFAIPAGMVIAIAMFLSFILTGGRQTATSDQKTTAILMEMVLSIAVLTMASRPINQWRAGLIVTMGILCALFVTVEPLRKIAELAIPWTYLPELVLIGVLGAGIVSKIWALAHASDASVSGRRSTQTRPLMR